MTFKTGMWGKQAKERSKKRLEYFKEYTKKRYRAERKKYGRQIGFQIPVNIRKEFLKEKELFCQVCKCLSINERYKGLIIHHKDKNKKNNNFNNLIIVCRGCHNKIHNTKRYKLNEG